MKKGLSKKTKIIISIIVVFILFIGGAAIWAADRFLIEHVEIDLSEEVPASNQSTANVGMDADTGSTLDVDSEAAQDGALPASPEGVLTSPVVKPATSDAALPASPDGTLKASPTKDPVPSKENLPTQTKGNSVSQQKSSSPSVKNEEVQNKADKESNGPEKYTATDMSYESDSKKINIQKVVTGQGADTVTYYVADIKLTDATQIKSAFAKNKFGLNIIEGTSVIAERNNAILAINGDYYGFRKDGIEIRDGRLFRNEPARTGLAFYKDGSMKVYDEKQVTGEELLENGVFNTLSFGPALVIEGKMGTDLATYEVDTNIGNHPIQGLQPRTGIGFIDKNHYVFVVVDGRSKGYSRGVELEEFAKIFQDLGCKTAYNLDGGGSSTMYFMGKRINKPCGKDKERGTSDIIYIN